MTRVAPRERAFMAYYAAAAMMETDDLPRANSYAREANRYFASGRHAVHEAMSVAELRMIDLRLGIDVPDPLLVEAASDCSTAVEGQLAWIEAGLAFRGGQMELCATLCERAVFRLQTSVAGPQLALAEALRASVLADQSLVSGVLSATRGVTPQVELQVLGLLARAFGPQPESRARALRLLPAMAGRDAVRPMELVSLQEVRRWLDLGDAA